MTIIFRPNTLEEALDILARPALVQITAGGPPPNPHPHALILDASRLSAMSGIQRAGGEMIIGVNTPHAALIRSRLLWPAAACLVDACRLQEDDLPGGALIHNLTPEHLDNPILLALTALDARVEMAVRAQNHAVERVLFPLKDAILTPPEAPHLLLNVRFAAGPAGATSALWREADLGALQPDAWAAAAWLVIDPDARVITAARLALAAGDAWPDACEEALTDLIGSAPGREAIEAAVRLAQRMCPQPRASSPLFSLALSAHLIRETLDRAIARASSQPG